MRYLLPGLVLLLAFVFLFPYSSPSHRLASEAGVDRDIIPYLKPLDAGGISEAERSFILMLPRYSKGAQFAIVTSFLSDGGLSDVELDFLMRADKLGIVEQVFRLPEVYDGVGKREIEYLDLIEKVKKADPDAARYVLETGLFFSDGKITSQERAYVDAAISNKTDLFRLFVARRSFFDKDSSLTSLSFRRSGVFGYLDDDLYRLPMKEDASARQARLRLADIMLASERDYELRKAILMIDDYGVPPQDFFNYSVPNYNTQLAVLMDLLEDVNVTPEYYRVAVAIAIDYGSVYTVGTDDARVSMRSYVADTFNYIVATDRKIKEKGLDWQASSYPLEADLALAWGAAGALRRYSTTSDDTGVETTVFGNASAAGNGSGDWYTAFKGQKLSAYEFERFFVTMKNLDDMQAWMFDKGFADASVFDIHLTYLRDSLISNFIYPSNYGSRADKTAAYLEEYIYVNGGHTKAEEKEFQAALGSLYTYTPNGHWFFFKKYGRFFGGVCYDIALIEQVLLKSANRASLMGQFTVQFNSVEAGNLSRTVQGYILYYDPVNGVWRATYNQLFGNIHGNIDLLEARPFLDTRYSFVPKAIPHKYGYVSIPWSNFNGRAVWYDFYKYSDPKPIFHTRYSIGFPLGYMFRELPFVESVPQTTSASIRA